MRTRLNVLVAATTALVALAFVVPLALQVRALAAERALRPAELATRTLAPAVALQDEPARTTALVEAAASGLEGPLGVVLADGTVIGAPLPDALADRVRAEPRTGRYPTPAGQVVVVPVAGADGIAVVHALVPGEALRRGVVPAWLILAALAVVLVGGATALADVLARRTLSALRRVEGLARRIADGDLAARASLADPPEIARVANVLGDLAARVERLLEAEREAAADLSHRLRTPLTPLRLDAEALPPSPERDRLLGDVESLEAGVTRVIRSFRSRDDTASASRCHPARVTRDRVAFWQPLADDQDRRLEVQVDPAVAGDRDVVAVSAEVLADALDALLGNVFSHTVEGVGMVVNVRLDHGYVVITVDDDGPGWPDGLAVDERGATGSPRSTGLGLDIARRAAEAGGGNLVRGTSGTGGASVAVYLPVPLA